MFCNAATCFLITSVLAGRGVAQEVSNGQVFPTVGITPDVELIKDLAVQAHADAAAELDRVRWMMSDPSVDSNEVSHAYKAAQKSLQYAVDLTDFFAVHGIKAAQKRGGVTEGVLSDGGADVLVTVANSDDVTSLRGSGKAKTYPRRLDRTTKITSDVGPAKNILQNLDPAILYYRALHWYDAIYEHIKDKDGITPRMIFTRLSRHIEDILTWIPPENAKTAKEAGVSVGDIWDCIIGSRAAVEPDSRNASPTAHAYNEAFWLKPVVISQMTRSQHILAYSLFQLQQRAQGETTITPAEGHGIWPWFTNEQIVKMVKAYDVQDADDQRGNGDIIISSDEDETEAGLNKQTAPRLAVSVRDASGEASAGAKHFAKALGYTDAQLEKLNQVEVEELLRLHKEMTNAQKEVDSQAVVDHASGKLKPAVRGVWPFFTYDQLVEMAHNKPKSEALAMNLHSADEGGETNWVMEAAGAGFSKEQISLLDDSGALEGAVELYRSMVEAQRNILRTNPGTPAVRDVWPWFSYDDLVNMAHSKGSKSSQAAKAEGPRVPLFEEDEQTSSLFQTSSEKATDAAVTVPRAVELWPAIKSWFYNDNTDSRSTASAFSTARNFPVSTRKRTTALPEEIEKQIDGDNKKLMNLNVQIGGHGSLSPVPYEYAHNSSEENKKIGDKKYQPGKPNVGSVEGIKLETGARDTYNIKPTPSEPSFDANAGDSQMDATRLSVLDKIDPASGDLSHEKLVRDLERVLDTRASIPLSDIVDSNLLSDSVAKLQLINGMLN